jgi:hypothetical protein
MLVPAILLATLTLKTLSKMLEKMKCLVCQEECLVCANEELVEWRVGMDCL